MKIQLIKILLIYYVIQILYKYLHSFSYIIILQLVFTLFSKITRPELQAAPQDFYNEEMTEMYQRNAHTQEIQQQLTRRCIELLNINTDKPLVALDIAAGTEQGFITFALDISQNMLQHNPSDYRLLADMSDTLPFQPGTFDAVISVSGLQWLCYSNSKDENPFKRLASLFSQLFAVLKPNASAVFQFYPANQEQLQLIQDAAAYAGFKGQLVIDNPNSTRAKKFYLVLKGGITAQCHGLSADKANRPQLQKKKKVIIRTNIKTRREEIIEKRIKELKDKKENVKPVGRYTGRKRR